MDLRCTEALYGGAAGGGKSDTLLMDAAQFCHVPGYGALILRRTHQELVLKGALIDRSHDWWGGTAVKWNGDDKRWTWPSGATIEFGYFDTWVDRSRYQSAAWNRIYFDELTQFPEDWYRFMFTRIRRVTGFQVPSAMRGATNPGNIGHKWVEARFPVHVTFEEQDQSKRRFLFASFQDNPHVDQEDYATQLEEAPPLVRRQMLGEWIDDGVGRVYSGFDETRNFLREELPEGEWSYVLGIDFGIVDPNAFTVLGWRKHDRIVYVLASYRKKGDAIDVAEEVVELTRTYPFSRIVGDTGGLGKGFAEQMIERHNIPVEAADKVNKVGYIQLLNGELAKGTVKLVRAATRDLVEELTSLQWHANGQKEAAGANHAADSMLYAWRAASAFGERTTTPVRRLDEAARIRAETDKAWDEAEREIEAQRREEREVYG